MSTNPIGVSTWLWTSPLTDDTLGDLAARVAGWGFDIIELPIERPDDWDPGRTRALVEGLGLGVTTCAVMTPDRDLTTDDRGVLGSTRTYLRTCVDIAASVGARVVAGPMYSPVGRVGRLDAGERRTQIGRVVEGLRPVADHAGSRGVSLALEPLNRYETNLVNTVEQALEIVDRVDAANLGICLDTFHMNIEEKDPAAAARSAGGRIAHVQACGTDRGTPGQDRFGWTSFREGLVAAGYDGPLCIESFTVDNAALARAASIWRPLAPSADALAVDGLAFLRGALAVGPTGAGR